MTKANEELALYRLQKAHETLNDARILAGAGRWNPCVNRLYYACFYAVSALLIQQGLSSSKHAGVRGLFNQHFVKTGKVAKEKAKVFVSVHAKNMAFLRHCEAFRPKQSQSFGSIRLLRFARSDKNAVFP